MGPLTAPAKLDCLLDDNILLSLCEDFAEGIMATGEILEEGIVRSTKE